ncbi:MAG: ATP-binding protein [Candidatus Aminicenantales bacterium]
MVGNWSIKMTMEELSLHILDIAENSVAAKADRIEIKILENREKDLLSVEISDNGLGMDEEMKKKALDPFFTTKMSRRFGLGLPLLSEAAKAANGSFSIKSQKGKGTKIKATFQYSHIDRQPLGDIAQTIIALAIGNPGVDIIYKHKKDGQNYGLDTRKIKNRLRGKPINSPEGIRMLKENLKNDTQEKPTGGEK